MNEKTTKAVVKKNTQFRDALKQMDKAGLQVLAVVDENSKFVGLITDGDARRGILNGVQFSDTVEKIMNPNPQKINILDIDTAHELMDSKKIRHLPVVDSNEKLIEIILADDFATLDALYPTKTTKVVIMAGGKGTRLDPFTKILPKPLIPVGEKPIIEIVMDKFQKFGFNKFLISLNYKAEMIKMYFRENQGNFNINYIEETEFLGTAGVLSLAKEELKETFILSNCDIISDTNFNDLLSFHKTNGNMATVVGIVRHIKIPYGIMTLKEASLESINEKPEYSFIINSGIYVLEPEILSLIPKNTHMHMPDLLMSGIKKNMKVQVYPSSSQWFDIGEWEEYRKAVDFVSTQTTRI